MKNNKIEYKQFALGTIINMMYPIFLSLVGWSILVYFLKFSYQTKGYSEVLESIINFSSIIIGFYTAMYGIMISLLDSDLFKIFRKNKVETYLKFQLYDSLIISFIVLILSIIMQVLVQQPKSNITNIFFNIWILLIGYFIGTSFRSISLFLKMIFNHNSKRTDKIDLEKTKKQINDLKRN
ncbi:hypothetical protein IGK74_000410 [Enterococcus sp. AZ150]|uniref:hypothetical protein n=1 Tax=Enterococcus sp. AZ150 TaxID=2774866 RepID=UPI003F246145